jgi:hypothetical protein
MRYATLLLSRVLLAGAMLAMASLSQVRADLVAGWDFQTTENGGTALVASPNTPKQITASFWWND